MPGGRGGRGGHGGRGRRRAHERDVDDEVPVIGADLQIAGEHVEEISGTEAKQVSDKCRKDYRNRPCAGLCAGQPNAGWFRPDQAAGARPYAGWLLPEQAAGARPCAGLCVGWSRPDLTVGVRPYVNWFRPEQMAPK